MLPPFFFVIYPVKITRTYVKKQETNNKLYGHISTCKSGLNPSVDFFPSEIRILRSKSNYFSSKAAAVICLVFRLLEPKSNLERSRWVQRLPRDYHMLPSSGNEVVELFIWGQQSVFFKLLQYLGIHLLWYRNFWSGPVSRLYLVTKILRLEEFLKLILKKFRWLCLPFAILPYWFPFHSYCPRLKFFSK